MVNFIKENLLGSLKEFRNRFINPIQNGQCADSTPRDVRIMKNRAHVLHAMLAGCVQVRWCWVNLSQQVQSRHFQRKPNRFILANKETSLTRFQSFLISSLHADYLDNIGGKSPPLHSSCLADDSVVPTGDHLVQGTNIVYQGLRMKLGGRP